MSNDHISKAINDIEFSSGIAKVQPMGPPANDNRAPSFKMSSSTGDHVQNNFSNFSKKNEEQTRSIGAQSVAQSMAIAIQDATDLLRNISTIETTAIGAATAKWIAEPENVFYGKIIESCNQVLMETAAFLETVGKNSAAVLDDYNSAETDE